MVNGRSGIRSAVQIVGFVALAAVPVLALNSLATADTGNDANSSPTSAAGVSRITEAPITEARQQCLADQGVTVPTPPADGSRPQLTEEQRVALRQAAEACGLPLGPRAVRGGGAAGTV